MEVVSINALDYEILRFNKQQIEELNLLADQLENGDIDDLEFSYAVLNVL